MEGALTKHTPNHKEKTINAPQELKVTLAGHFVPLANKSECKDKCFFDTTKLFLKKIKIL